MDALLSDKRWSRRQLLKGLFNGGAALATAGVAQATVVEPEWLKIEKHRVGSSDLGVCFAQITDLHFHRPNSLLKEVVESVRALKPEFICFTGDLVEKRHELPGAVEFLKALDCPIFGIPGNHDRTSRVSDTEFREAFTSCGGMWLVNQVVQPTSKNLDRKSVV